MSRWRSALSNWRRWSTALGISADYLLGRSGKQPALNGPTGKARQVFERVSKLPRARQQYIIKVVEDLVGSVNGK